MSITIREAWLVRGAQRSKILWARDSLWICRMNSVQGEKLMAAVTTSCRPPFPPFTFESAMEKVRLAEDGWNTRDPAKVALGYTVHSRWRNRSEFINGRNEIIDFLSASGPGSWTTGLSRKCGHLSETGSPYASLTRGTTGRITGIAPTAMRTGNSTVRGFMASRFASINDVAILASDRKYHWLLGRRPDGHPGLSDLGFWLHSDNAGRSFGFPFSTAIFGPLRLCNFARAVGRHTIV